MGESRWGGERKTKAWERYERGRAYNNRLTPSQYDLVNTNIAFFAGNQWLHLAQTPAMQKLPKPTFNIIKRVASLFVASLTSSAATVSFDELSYYSSVPEASGAGRMDRSEGEGGGRMAARPARGGGKPDVASSRGMTAGGKGYEGRSTGAPGKGFTFVGERRSAGMGELSPAGGSKGYGGRSDEDAPAAVATAEVQNLLEKFKMDYRIREALFDGAQTGDYCAHFWWDPEAIPYGGAFGPYRGEIRMELVDGINVMFGNPNTPDVERQPYILIVGRDTVDNLRREMERHRGGSAGWSDEIQPDAEYAFQAGAGGRMELEADGEDGKALYVYMYEKHSRQEMMTDPETGEETRRTVSTVHVTKATKSCVIYEDVDTGLSRYPIAWGNWEKQKNQYHGRALVTGIIPNQIFINSMFAMVMRHLQLMGFPKTVYNADLIGKWSGEVGQAIAVRGLQPGQSISQVAYSLQPADMSSQIIMAIDKAITYTKDCLGATDAQMGNVRPDNTSALMVLQSSAEVPLENTRAGLYEWLEDIGGILLDMMGTYYGRRPIVREREMNEPVRDPATGLPVLDRESGVMRTGKVRRRVAEEYDFARFKNLWFNVRVNAGATTYYSEIAMVQTLDNLRRDGTLEVIDYLERIPDRLIPRKEELVRELKSRAATQGGAGAPMSAAVLGAGMAKKAEPKTGLPAVGGALSEEKVLAELPGATQARYEGLPKAARSALLKKAML